MKKELYIERCHKNGIIGFDYSLLPNNIKKQSIFIICDKHGKFKSNPYHFSVGNTSCYKCKVNDKIKKRIIEKFGNKFDLSKIEYKNSISKLILIENGIEYYISYKYLMKLENTVLLKNVKKIYSEEFIKKFLVKHSNKFDYSLTEYKNSHTKIKIKCNKHDILFEQSPLLHLKSDICCPLCVKEYKSFNSPRNNGRSKFIELAKKLYKDKYDYSKVEYVNNKTPIIIIYDGEEYLQRPDSHLQGKSPEKEWKKNLGTTKFIEKSIDKHGLKYSYDCVSYKNHKDKVKIFCHNHGYFEQSPVSHLKGYGCPSCIESDGERMIRIFLTKNNILYEYQKTFKKCRNKLPLPFDFYLPDYNICIEFDGIQHKRPISFFGGIDAYNKLKINDSVKTNFCKENNIILIRLDNKNLIEDLLNNNIFKYNKLSQMEKNKKFIEKAMDIWGYKYDYSKIDYIDSKTPITIIYKSVEYKQTPTKHLQGKKCELSNNSLSRNEFIRRCEEKWGNRFDYTDTVYKNSYSKITFYDRFYDFLASQKASSHMEGHSYSISKDNFIKLANLASDFKNDYSSIDYKNLNSIIKIFCKEHGYFETRGYDHLKNRLGGSCKICSEYSMLKATLSFLKKHNINHYQEHRFDSLSLPFDFYIPSMRTVIEFDGIQHFQPVSYFGGIEAYEKLKVNDKIKNDYCEENYIDIIRIRYDQIDDIYQILWNSLKVHINRLRLN
jgi:very-short-patch-repair endonuclease